MSSLKNTHRCLYLTFKEGIIIATKDQKVQLSKEMDSETFLSFYYLKEELVDFCRKNGLPTSGGKIEIAERIAHFLDTGEIIAKKSAPRKKACVGDITKETVIEKDFVCSEKHRAFFNEQIGSSFSFNVVFQKWLKENAGKHTVMR